MSKTEYNKVQELINIFDEYWVPYTFTELKTDDGFIIGKLVDEKSGDTYLERYDAAIDTFTVYKFDKFSVPTTWNIEEDSDVSVVV